MEKKPLTKSEFEALLSKAAQPLPELGQQPAQEEERTSESQTSGDCSDSHTHSDRSGDI